MLRYPRCIAPVLLASFVGLIATSARAAPASTAADADCLAQPGGQPASGHHWYYRVERASGRKCWYQRAVSAAQASVQTGQASAQKNDAVPARSVPPRAAPPPPAASAASDRAADRASDVRGQAVAEPAAAPMQSFSWSTATPAPVPSQPMTPPAADSAAPAPAQVAAPTASPESATADEPVSAEPLAPVSRAPPRAATVERATAPVEVEEGTHLPALLSAALALLIVVVGSIVARFAARVIRSRRRNRAPDAGAAPPIYPARGAPGLVPAMPRERDITREARQPRPPMARPAAHDRPNGSGDAVERVRDETRAMEENVRDLLRRMRSDLPDQRPLSAAPAAPQPTAAQELDRMLANMRERQRKSG